MTGGHDDIDLPFTLTDDERSEHRMRYLKQHAPRVLVALTIQLTVGIVLRGFIGGLLIGMAIMTVTMHVKSYLAMAQHANVRPAPPAADWRR